ncbi:hypothetical protein GGI20_001378 [Coemansia sp. BCRC 34301]|nr:hypothetical protein GGI20_001378 [Coemansia sp. BCRC 34301]
MPPKRPRNLRRVNKDDTDWENDGNAIAECSASATKDGQPGAVGLDDLLEFQRFRRQRQRGLEAGALAKGERKRNQAPNPQEASRAGNVDEDDEGEPSGRPEGLSTARSLSGAFTVQTNKLDANKHMMEYIETEMNKHRGVSAAIASTTAGAGLSVDDLYQVPKHLRVVDERPVSEGNVAMATRMLTSIQEVDLGAESKARNARATNIVVTELSHTPSGSAIDPLSPSSNTRYRKGNDPSDRSSKATDDVVLQRFKKRMRR